MHIECHAEPRLRALSAILGALSLAPLSVSAGTVDGPSSVVTLGPGSTVESWMIFNRGTLISNGAQLLSVSVSDRGTLEVNGGQTGRVSATDSGVIRLNGSTTTASTSPISGGAVLLQNGATADIQGASITDTQGRALVLQLNVTSAGPIPGPSATVARSSLTGVTAGVLMSGGGSLRIDQGTTVVATGAAGAGLQFSSGNVTVAGGSSLTGGRSGVVVTDGSINEDDPGRFLTVDGSSVVGQTGSGILVDAQVFSTPTIATITLANGAAVTGANGIAVETALNAKSGLGDEATVNILNSRIAGDMVSRGGRFDLHLSDASSLSGSAVGLNAMSLDRGSSWNVAGDSDVRLLSMSADSSVVFERRADGGRSALTVHGDLSGAGGSMVFNTALNAGGTLGAQATDRLLVEGNVTTTGTTYIDFPEPVEGGGDHTDTNRNGAVDANEGISLVQVGGSSRADAFALRRGYVAAGGYQYTLHAFGPGQTDPAQNALANGAALNWDYRLGNRACTEEGCGPVEPPPVDPGNPPPPCDGQECGPVEPPPPPERNAVVPQLPSYLSAPAALLSYGDMLNDGLRQRLGDIRNGESGTPLGGEVFARYLGGQLRYESNRSFENYGYDFDQQVNALQIGGSLISLDGDEGSLRAGWAIDHGTTRVSPQAVDGDSSAKYRATGATAWVTWQAGSGWWVDAVIAGQRYRGDVATDLRGSDMARIRATGTTMSAEIGKPFAFGADWIIEPRAQVKYQALRFRDFGDADGLAVDLGTARQTSTRIGALVSRVANPRLMPYARLDLTHTSNGDPSVDVSSDAWGVTDRFGSGRVGNAVRVAAGATSQLTPHVQLYGEGTYQRFVGSYGLRGWSGNLGVRVTF